MERDFQKGGGTRWPGEGIYGPEECMKTLGGADGTRLLLEGPGAD